MEIIPLSEKREQKKSSPEKRAKRDKMLKQVNREMKEETGIDFLKMFMGDEKEKRRFEMKRLQDKLEEDDDEQ